MKKFNIDWFIFVLISFALLLRLPGIMNGLPAVYHSTEYFLAKTALNLGAQKTLDPGVYIYPTFYLYLLFLSYGFYYITANFIGLYDNIKDFALQFLIDPSSFYITTRGLNVILSLFTIYILYKTLNKYANKDVARIAATTMVVSHNMIHFSTFATADMLLVFFSTLSILYFYILFDKQTSVDFFLAGLFTGLAVAAKYNAGFLVVGLLITIIILWRSGKINFLKPATLSLSGVVIGFLLPNPLWLVYPQRFFEGFQLIYFQMYSAVSVERGIIYLWEILELLRYELVLGFLFFVATVYYLICKDKKHLSAVIVIFLTFLYVGSWSKKGIDYLLAIYPAWIIIVSFMISEFSSKISIKKHLLTLVLTIIYLPAIAGALYHNILYLNDDTREQATEWIITNIRHDEMVCYDNTHYDLGVFDVNRYISYGASADKLPESVKEELKKYENDTRQVNFIHIQVSNPSFVIQSNNPYEEEAAKFRRLTLSELKRLGTDYMICNSRFYNSYLSADLGNYPEGIQIVVKEVQDFYQQLFDYYKPVMVFKPDFWTAGPEIRIYNLNQLNK